jgi:hypothetical protein
VKIVGKVLRRATWITRRRERTGVTGFVGAGSRRFRVAAVIFELLRLGIVVRRSVVVVGSSVPTHAGPLVSAGGACSR